MRYPATVNLPFNHNTIKKHFTPLAFGSSPPEEEGYWLIIQGNSLVVSTAGDAYAIPLGARPTFLPDNCKPLCFGIWQGGLLRAATISRDTELPEGYGVEAFNASGDRLDDETLTLGGIAMQLLHWQKKSRFCSACGGGLTPMKGSWGRLCASCHYEHFPSIHPCSIVLVRNGDRFLMARKKEWPVGRYGLVAGFLDMGESLEECAAREVFEETGITVKNVTYVGSQCWPFPSQLMAGFVAEYESGEIRVDKSELEDARWFSRQKPPEGLPPSRSIARWIIDRYLFGSE